MKKYIPAIGTVVLLAILLGIPRGVIPAMGHGGIAAEYPIVLFSWGHFLASSKTLLSEIIHNQNLQGIRLTDLLWSGIKSSYMEFVLGIFMVFGLGTLKGIYDGSQQRKSPIRWTSSIVQWVFESIPDFFIICLLEVLTILWWIHGHANISLVGAKTFFTSILIPSILASILPMMYVARVVRAAIEDEYRQDYVVTAKSKGLRKLRTLLRHILPNIYGQFFKGTVTAFSLYLSSLVMVDYLYARQDIVQKLYRSIGEYGDYPPYVPTDLLGHGFLSVPFDPGTTLMYVLGIAFILFVVWCTLGGVLLSLGFRNVANPYSGTIKITRSGGKGSITIGFLMLIAVMILPFVQRYLPIPSPDSQTKFLMFSNGDIEMVPFPPFTKNFLLGSDPTGSDMLSMTIHNTWPTLLLVAECTLATIIPAFILSIIGGIWRFPFIRGVNFAWASLFKIIPSLLACLFILDIPDVYWYDVHIYPGFIEWGNAFQYLFIFVLAFTEIGRVTEVLQNAIDSIQVKSFVEASETLGASQWAKFRQHIKRPFTDALFEQVVVSASRLLLLLASLSFFGHTLHQAWQAPIYKKDPWLHFYNGNDWITLIASNAHQWFAYPWMLLAPILFITLTVISLNLIQTGLREYFQSAHIRPLQNKAEVIFNMLRPTFVVKWGDKRTRVRALLSYLAAMVACVAVVVEVIAPIHSLSKAASSNNVSGNPSTASLGDAPKTVNLSSFHPIRVGEWLYTFHSLQERTRIGGESGRTANGVYFIVNVTLKNLDTTISSTATSDMFTIFSDSHKFQTDPIDTIGSNPDGYNDFFERAVRAGRSMTSNVVFDVPPQLMHQHCVLQLGDGVLNEETAKMVLIK